MFHLLFEKVNKFYEKVFEIYGRFVAKYFIFIICISFTVNLLLSLGMLKIKMITDTDTLFMTIDSEARRDEKFLKDVFNKSNQLSSDYYLHQILDLGTWAEINFQPCKTENILDEIYLKEIKAFNDMLLEKAVVKYENRTIGFKDVCATRNSECLIDGIDLVEPGFYKDWLTNSMKRKERNNEEMLLMDNEDEPSSNNPQNEFRFYIKSNGTKLSFNDLTYILGKDFHVNSYKESNNLTTPGFAKILKLRYNLKSDFENADPIVKQWEIKVIDVINNYMKDYLKLSSDSKLDLGQQCKTNDQKLRISYAASQSLDMEMAANIGIDSKLISGTFMLIMFFASIIMSINSNCITSPGMMLPFSGILSAIFGITSSFGLMSLIGYSGCNLIFVIPFLVIGIGIDDMFIIYSSFLYFSKKEKEKAYENSNIQKTDDELTSDIISKTLSRSGVSITITSLTDFVAFLVGITTGFRSVQIFCIYAGFAIAFCYLYQITFFTGFLCIHSKRILKKHNSMLFCFKQEKFNSFKICNSFTCCSEVPDIEPQQQICPENIQLSQTNNVKKPSIKRNNRKNSKFEKKSSYLYFKKIKNAWLNIFKFLITTKKGKCITIILYLIYLSFSIWNAWKIHEGINLADLVSEDSYYSYYIRDNAKLIDLNPVVIFTVYEPIDYDNNQNRIKLKNLLNDAYKIDGISKNFNLNWLDSFKNRKIKYKNNINNLLSIISTYPPFINDLIINKIEIDTLTNKTTKTILKYDPFKEMITDNDEEDEQDEEVEEDENEENDQSDKQIEDNESKNEEDTEVPEDQTEGDSFNSFKKHKSKRSKRNNDLHEQPTIKVEYEITASRFFVQYDRLYFSSLDAKQMHLLRKLCKESGLPIIPYSIAFKFYEQFEQTLPNVLQAFLISMEAMYLISLIFIPDLVSVICIIISMGSIMVGLVGWMHIWGLSLSSITMIELIMSVGFCIDFSAHITHAFITNGTGDRNKRAFKSFLHVGVPIFNSALSTIVGISLLAFCKSFIFISFFKTLTILMCLGILNSLLFLPVLLSLIGPNWPRHKEPNNTDNEENNDRIKTETPNGNQITNENLLNKKSNSFNRENEIIKTF